MIRHHFNTMREDVRILVALDKAGKKAYHDKYTQIKQDCEKYHPQRTVFSDFQCTQEQLVEKKANESASKCAGRAVQQKLATLLDAKFNHKLKLEDNGKTDNVQIDIFKEESDRVVAYEIKLNANMDRGKIQQTKEQLEKIRKSLKSMYPNKEIEVKLIYFSRGGECPDPEFQSITEFLADKFNLETDYSDFIEWMESRRSVRNKRKTKSNIL